MERYHAEREKHQNVVGRRIGEARRQHKLSLTGLSALLSEYGVAVGRTAINKWESGESVPNAYQLLALCQALDIEAELPYFMACCKQASLNAEGQQKLSAYREDLIASGRYRHAPEAEEIRYIEMPVSQLAASAGTGSFLDEGSFEMTRVNAAEVLEGAAFGVRVSGDSMEPVYHDAQIVWVRPCDSLRPGEVGIMVYDGEGYIKVYGTQMPPEGEREAYTRSDGTIAPQPVLISYNANYPPRPVSADMGFQIVGKVL
ncbi:MAG: XRE family transcriptional regulator [Oscillospiraceae bacterium]|nr:XRE family transcriptional regulator [Oscillospiraceae bacterium]